MNLDLFYFFNNLSHKTLFLDEVIIFIAEGLPYVVIVFAISFILFHDDRIMYNNLVLGSFDKLKQKTKEFTLLFFTGFFAWFLSLLLKYLFVEDRPFVSLQGIVPLWHEVGYAFPSSHSAVFMAIAFAIFLEHKRMGIYFIFFAIIIGLARIVAGVHYPIDILGGFILGIFVSYLVKFLYKK